MNDLNGPIKESGQSEYRYVHTAVDGQHGGIPKLVMQTWKTCEVPKEWKLGQASVKAMFPSWTYILMNDKDMYEFVRVQFPELFQGFCELPYTIQRIDLFRYLWLYEYGGLYIDLDYEVRVSFEHLLVPTNALYVLHTSNMHNSINIFTNSLIACRPKLQFLYDIVVDAITVKSNWHLISQHIHVMTTTGPIAFTRALWNNFLDLPYVVLPKHMFLPVSVALKDLHDPNVQKQLTMSKAYTIPLEGGTWHEEDTLFINFLNRHKASLCFMLLLGFLFFYVKHHQLLLYYRTSFRKKNPIE